MGLHRGHQALIACPKCGSAAGVYVERLERRIYHYGIQGTLIREVSNGRSGVVSQSKTVRCIACNGGFRWKPPTRSP